MVSGDLDEFAVAGLRAEPVDSYGVGTSLVTGSGAPTANMVYKLVEVDGIPVEKRSVAQRIARRPQRGTAPIPTTGTITEEIVYPAGHPPAQRRAVAKLTVPLVRNGEAIARALTLGAARELVASGLRSCRGRV